MITLMGYICITIEFTKNIFLLIKKLFKKFFSSDYNLKFGYMKLKSIVIVENNVTVKL